MIHSNSKEAYNHIMFNGAKTARAKAVLKIIEGADSPLSDYQVLQVFKSGSDNLNLVRPRITELYKAGILEEGYPVKSHEGETNVRTSRIKDGVVDRQVVMF